MRQRSDADWKRTERWCVAKEGKLPAVRVTGRKNNITRKVIRKEKKHENKEN